MSTQYPPGGFWFAPTCFRAVFRRRVSDSHICKHEIDLVNAAQCSAKFDELGTRTNNLKY
jgi:hypothetical protein